VKKKVTELKNVPGTPEAPDPELAPALALLIPEDLKKREDTPDLDLDLAPVLLNLNPALTVDPDLDTEIIYFS